MSSTWPCRVCGKQNTANQPTCATCGRPSTYTPTARQLQPGFTTSQEDYMDSGARKKLAARDRERELGAAFKDARLRSEGGEHVGGSGGTHANGSSSGGGGRTHANGIGGGSLFAQLVVVLCTAFGMYVVWSFHTGAITASGLRCGAAQTLRGMAAWLQDGDEHGCASTREAYAY